MLEFESLYVNLKTRAYICSILIYVNHYARRSKFTKIINRILKYLQTLTKKQHKFKFFFFFVENVRMHKFKFNANQIGKIIHEFKKKINHRVGALYSVLKCLLLRVDKFDSMPPPIKMSGDHRKFGLSLIRSAK